MIAVEHPQWEVVYHEHYRLYFLQLPIGIDAKDGQPLWYATPLRDVEPTLWQRGETEALARCLRARGIPLPGPCGLRESKWKRYLKALRHKFFGGK